MTVAPELILILGGKSYDEAKYLVAPMVLGVAFRFFSHIYSAFQNYEKKTHFVAAGTICVMILNVVLNYVCILKFGYQAAAYTTAFSYLVLIIVQGILEKKVCGKRLIPLRYMILMALLMSALCAAATASFGLSWPVRWAAAVVLGCITLAAVLKSGIIKNFR